MHEYKSLVAFNNSPPVLETLREDRFEKQRKSLLGHLSYFAKERTKVYSREARSFGGSVR
ncbi:YagK/YfjJ domain-containing protein [Citrobacter amalonaticus]|uniref:YagK/YfjJ domain-containing protein n=1 Tax=Citrobacter amalonaticus TaxID=35703 RepID=UPI002A367CFA|nr:inovirus-type Gp2 protein [Citrobacter amalonaticus]